jgi:Tol biopolymer transport system component
MAFAVGDRLGRFEIVGSLGAGGMGEVYRARDPHLQRDVAIKVLPSEFSSDPVRRRRFEQEARAAGGLNHPNILAVYDVGVEAHTSYIVTEVLEGQTMGERLEGKPLPPRKAVDYARQIASGLAAAHAHGVVHRDIKPGNLFVTTDGRVKILDFGLAKFVGPEADDTNTVTVSVDGVQQKPILGSLTYMSPEQARGIRLDHRTDIFSFGVVLYEMLAGFAPFRRPTPGETMQAILYDDVPALPTSAPEAARLERIVRHCLEKNPSERFQNVHDLVFDLDAQAPDTTSDTVTHRWSRAAQLAAALLLVLAAVAAGAFIAMQLLPASPTDLYRVRTVTNTVGLEEFAAISPNGDMVAFTQVEGQRRQIFVRFLKESSVPLRVTSDASTDHQSPRWSSDGTLFYFSPAGPGEVQGAIYRVPALGGSPAQRVMASIGGGDISRSGRLTCFRLDQGRIELVTAALDGSDIRVVAGLKAQHYQYPRWSPDEQTIAYQAGDGFRWDLYIAPASGGTEPAQLTTDAKVVKGLAWLPDNSGLVFSSARASSFSYLPPLTMWQVSRDGTLRQMTPPEASYEQPDVDQSGLLAATRLQMRYDIWEYPVDRETSAVDRGRRVTRQTGQLATPAVSPDGLNVAYISDHGGHANIWIAPLDGRGPGRQLTRDDDPDASIGVPAWSPDGQWIAYLSSKGNGGLKFGVWLIRPDGSDNKRILPLGLSPQWSNDSAWLYYVEESNKPIMRVDVKTGVKETAHTEPARNVIGVHDGTVYYVIDRALVDGRREFDLRAAPIGTGQSRLVTTLPTAQTPDWQIVNPALSPNGLQLAVPLTDGFTTNIWTIATDNSQRKARVTNFGDRAIFISRRLAWSVDGRSILAAIGEGDADIVLLDGLLRRPAGAR